MLNQAVHYKIRDTCRIVGAIQTMHYADGYYTLEGKLYLPVIWHDYGEGWS